VRSRDRRDDCLKLYNSNFAPNPRRARIFLAEKGVSIPWVEVDLVGLEHKGPDFSALNPFQAIPLLELDDGTVIDMAKLEEPQVADWAAANRPRALRNMTIFDQLLRDRPFIAGDRFTGADITGLVALDFVKPARIVILQELVHLNRWRDTLAARPSASA
jgi:glutathione S-transferase